MKAFVLVAAVLTASPLSVQAEDILGVQEYGSNPITLVHEYEGLTKFISKTLKRPVRFESERMYSTYMDKAVKKRYLLIYGPPSMTLEAYGRAGYEPLVRRPGALSATFMSLAKTGIGFPEDLKGKRLGLPESGSMVSLLALESLRLQKIDPDNYFKSISYFKDANEVLFAMQSGMVDVGVANSSAFNAWTASGNDLNVVMQGQSMPHCTLAVRDDLPSSEKKLLRDALLKAQQDTDARRFFSYEGFPYFERADMTDYAALAKALHMGDFGLAALK